MMFKSLLLSSANVLFIFTMFLGPLVSLMSNNWIVVWFGVELAFISFMPLLLMGKYFSMSKEASMKYFCIQALGSGYLFMSGVMIFLDLNVYFEIFFLFSICLKLGLFPGHFWVPSITSSLDWFPCFILITWQKVGPLALLMLYLSLTNAEGLKMILVLGGLSSLVGGLIGNNLNNVRAMIGASSVSHAGWLALGCVTGNVWLYFSLYCGVLLLTMSYLWSSSWLSSLGLLSLSGLPPFSMFVGKWSVISSFISSELSLLYLVLPILGTVFSLIFYLKFFYSFYLNTKNSNEIKSFYGLLLFNLLGLSFLVFFFGDRNI